MLHQQHMDTDQQNAFTKTFESQVVFGEDNLACSSNLDHCTSAGQCRTASASSTRLALKSAMQAKLLENAMHKTWA